MAVSSSFSKPLRFQLTALIGLSIFGAASAQAQWIGATSGTTNDVAHSYVTTSNWTGGIVLDTLTLAPSAATTLYFSSDYTTAGDFTINTSTASTLTLQGGGLFDSTSQLVTAASRSLILNGNMTVELNGNAGNGTLNFGTKGTNSDLFLDLNNGTRTITVGGHTTGTNPVTYNRDTLNMPSGITGGTGSLIKQGLGLLILNDAGTYTGTTTISNGALRILNSNALGTGNATVNITGSTSLLQIQGGITVSKPLNFSSTATFDGALQNTGGNNIWSGNLTVDGSAGIIRVASASGKLTVTGTVTTSGGNQFVALQGAGDAEYTNVISGSMPLTRSSNGTGVLTLSALNTYTGATQISNGTLLVNNNAPNGAPGALGNATSAVNLTATSGNAPRLLTNGAFTVGRNITTATSGTGTILAATLGGNAAADSTFSGSVTYATPLTLSQVANGTVNFSGAIVGSPAVSIAGSGTINFNTTPKAYTGTTSINSLAKLLVNTTVASPTVTVNGTLGGSGTLSGAVNVGASGIIAPGNSAGTLTTGALTLDALSILNYELASPGTVGMNVNDLLTVNGNLALNGTVNVTDLGGFGLGTYRLIDYTGTLSGNGLTVAPLPGGYTGFVDTSVPNQVNLVVSAIPEPSTFVLGAVGILGLAILRRRRAG